MQWQVLVTFTFQYVSINTVSIWKGILSGFYFTFQYVSINTTLSLQVLPPLSPLHSNMFLLIPGRLGNWEALQKSLHSNMFLLILVGAAVAVLSYIPLHSNMFLLIPIFNYPISMENGLYIPICFY